METRGWHPTTGGRATEREGGGGLVYVYREQIRAKPARRGVLFADARREEGTMAGRGGERGREEGREGGEAKVAGGQEFIDLRRGQMHIDLCNSEITRSLEKRTRGGGEGREREREREKSSLT